MAKEFAQELAEHGRIYGYRFPPACAVYGKPIHAFQREYKMQAATKLLVTTKMSIAEIAGIVGYENPNKFSTAFKEIIGQSPSEYRKSRN